MAATITVTQLYLDFPLHTRGTSFVNVIGTGFFKDVYENIFNSKMHFLHVLHLRA